MTIETVLVSYGKWRWIWLPRDDFTLFRTPDFMHTRKMLICCGIAAEFRDFCNKSNCISALSKMLSNNSTTPFFTRDSIYAIARICYRPSVCPSVRLSVRLSVTRVYHRKTVEVMITKVSPLGSPVPLVFRDQVSSRNSGGFPQSRALNEGGGR